MVTNSDKEGASCKLMTAKPAIGSLFPGGVKCVAANMGVLCIYAVHWRGIVTVNAPPGCVYGSADVSDGSGVGSKTTAPWLPHPAKISAMANVMQLLIILMFLSFRLICGIMK